jgi:hypothetical protein
VFEPQPVVHISSLGFRFHTSFDVQELESPKAFKKLIGPYAATKLALSLWSQEIAPPLAAQGIRIRSVDPGGNNRLRRGNGSGLPFYIKPLQPTGDVLDFNQTYILFLGKQEDEEPDTYYVRAGMQGTFLQGSNGELFNKDLTMHNELLKLMEGNRAKSEAEALSNYIRGGR